jgi:hypothetical protein
MRTITTDSELNSLHGRDIFLFFPHFSGRIWGKPSLQSSGYQRLFNREESGPWVETDHSPPSVTYVNNAWSYTSTRPYVFMAWCLIKHRYSFNMSYGVEYSHSNPKNILIATRIWDPLYNVPQSNLLLSNWNHLGNLKPGRETDHSPPYNVEVENGGTIPPFHHMSPWRGV